MRALETILPLPMIRAVLFDLDDTLVDHRDATRAALAKVRATFPALAAMPVEDLAAANQRILEALHGDVALGRITAAAARIERYRRLFALAGGPDDRASAAAELHRRTYVAARRRVDGALELVAALRTRVRVAVVTNNTVAEQREKLAAFGFAPEIDALVTSEEVGAAKPDARIFLAALARLECAPADAIMVGDSWHHDVLGAVAAGLRAVWFNRHGGAHPDPFIAPQIRSFTPTDAAAATLLAAGRGRPAAL
ncbi:MAG: HAD family hydrolase [Burkholderiales bacterium]